MELPWELFLPPESTFPQIHALVTDEPNWGFNAGVFLLRINPLTLTMMLDATSKYSGPSENNGTPEQSALDDTMMEPKYRDHVIFQVWS